MDELNSKLDRMMVKIDNLTSSVDFLGKKYEEIKGNIKILMDNQEILNKSLEKIKNENKKQVNTINELEERVEFLERSALSDTMNFYPVLQVKDENLMETIDKIGSAINITLDNTTVVSAFRRPVKKNGNPGEIVIKLRDSKLKEKVIELVKIKKLLNKDIGFNCKLSRIFANEELSKQGKNIYFTALKYKYEKKWKFVWIKGGRVYVKKEEGGNTYRLDSMSVLEGIK